MKEKLKKERLNRITQVLNELEHSIEGQPKRTPDWDAELAYILEGGGKTVPVIVVCDVYSENKAKGIKYAFEIKAPLPNSDQTKVSKEKLLKLYSMENLQIEAYFVLPYNPYGRKEDYAWSFPKRWFNMTKDKVVLIGEEFWEKVGGMNTYKAFIEAVNELGKEYKSKIYREFLGMEPPSEIKGTL